MPAPTTRKLARRHYCEHQDNPAAGLSTFHTRGNGKPRTKRCTYCGGRLVEVTGLWGVFEWRGDGRYRLADAIRTFTIESRADAWTRSQAGMATYPAGLVVRWMPDSLLDTTPPVKRTPECAGTAHYRCLRRPGCDPALDHDGYCACECHADAQLTAQEQQSGTMPTGTGANNHAPPASHPSVTAASDHLTPGEETALYDTLRRGASKRRGITADPFDGTWDDIDDLLGDLDFDRAHWLRPAPSSSVPSQPPDSDHGTPGTPRDTQHRPASRRYPIELPSLATDAEFLGACGCLADTLLKLAHDIEGWADVLSGLSFPRPVLAALADVTGCIAAAAVNILQAARALRSEYEDAREVAARGMRITGSEVT